MLRNRSRAAMSSKQTLMADQSSQPSPTQKGIPSFFGSPRFKAFTTKTLFDSESTISPTSILDTKPFFPYKNPFGYDLTQPKSPNFFSENKQTSPDPVGLALIDNPAESNNSSEKYKKTVLFATNLRVQIPPSPPDFGIKKRNSQFHPNSGTPTKHSPRIFTGIPLPVCEMELSEDYTCVILHGPQPKKTHIFDNCIVEIYCVVPPVNPPQEPQSFFSHCFTCKKNLEQKNDIYIYKGEKGFCSQECRYQEMVSDGLGE